MSSHLSFLEMSHKVQRALDFWHLLLHALLRLVQIRFHKFVFAVDGYPSRGQGCTEHQTGVTPLPINSDTVKPAAAGIRVRRKRNDSACGDWSKRFPNSPCAPNAVERIQEEQKDSAHGKHPLEFQRWLARGHEAGSDGQEEPTVPAMVYKLV